ncbi:DUF2231 domain-containing protein [Phenylobacterium sp.]|jgi:uncharacterized membrane protein|uniref:DUF2231 domain-containing protein n=1 Tax=Phenylobacterium sp. TaxID=1871053 RepID=UPI002F93823D
MTDDHPHSTAKVAGHPLHPMLIPFPIAFLTAAPVTDVVYLATDRPGWAEASMWLLGAGIASALLAAVLGFIDFFGDKDVRRLRQAWLHMIGNLVAVALAAVSFYLRSTAGAQEAVAPAGVTLSMATLAIMLFTAWLGGELVYRHRVGIDAGDLEPVRVRSGR